MAETWRARLGKEMGAVTRNAVYLPGMPGAPAVPGGRDRPSSKPMGQRDIALTPVSRTRCRGNELLGRQQGMKAF